MKLLTPTYAFNTVFDITVDFVKSHNISGLILDKDNTLMWASDLWFKDEIRVWMKTMRRNGVSLFILTNGTMSNVMNLSTVPWIEKARKPFKKSFNLAIIALNLDKENVCVVGDSLFTDIAGAHNAGLRSILVRRIAPEHQFISRLKRRLEQPFMPKFFK